MFLCSGHIIGFIESLGKEKGGVMAVKLFDSRGVSLEKQRFTWKDMVQPPISKLDDEAFTRVRIILMNGLEVEALRFQHLCARMNKELQVPLAKVRRVEQHQVAPHLTVVDDENR
jgi:hypothetical protein